MGKQLRRWWRPILLIVGGLLLVIGTRYAAPLYRQSIMQVTASKVTRMTKTEDEFNNRDHQYTQQLTGRLLNGSQRGQLIHVKNVYTASGAFDQKYRVGDQVFISMTRKSILIKGLKRDTVLLTLLWLAVVLLVLMLHRAGMMALLSVLLNLVIFFLAIELDLVLHSNGFLWLFGGLALVFALLTLWLILGPTKQMVITFAATVSGTVLSMGLSVLVLMLTQR